MVLMGWAFIFPKTCHGNISSLTRTHFTAHSHLDTSRLLAVSPSSFATAASSLSSIPRLLLASDLAIYHLMALRALLTKRTIGLGFQTQAKLQSRGLQTVTLPDLPYDYGALEPAISGEIMHLHHQKHHQAYITNYNKALEQLHEALNKGDSSTVVKLQSAIKFNGGGHVNHSFFWKNLAPVKEGGGEPPKASLGSAIDTNFGSLEALVKKINAEGAALQGSGWVWLALDKEFKKLLVETTPNQDPLVTKGASFVPLIGIDVWEHAYYLQYKNVRPDYLKNIWKVINWQYASEIYDKESV